ncbi:DUF2917 domain-containing protein [Limnohabitans sp. T6-5]|uniref:DUF2917 domain-containing protein n=1 Tax=Limnohabitans sp. T6-5 TaxID=1100724 RepID=UPI001304E9CD|nr:DUF2917 domain-containing protein [Limnohabitans sp. T6-5]
MHSEQRQALPAQGILTLRKQPAMQLRVISGRVWLTESRDPGDHFLQAGDTFRLHSDRAVVEALKDSLIAFTPLAAAAQRAPQQGASLQALVASRWQHWRQPLAAWFQRPFSG